MKNTLRRLADILAMLIGLNANQRILAVLLTVAGIIALDWFSNGLLEMLDGEADFHHAGFWIQVLALPIVLIAYYLITRAFYVKARHRELQTIQSNNPPSPHQGLIIFLSTFRTFPNKLPPEYQYERWGSEDLLKALANEDVDWRHVLDHIQASNMQTPLEAARYHYNSGSLRTIWVLATSDMKDNSGQVRPGSSRLIPLFRRLVKEGLGWNVDIIFQEENMLVPAYDVQAVFEAVRYIYETASRYGIYPQSIIADITGGTVTMSAGMTLYCALTRRSMQYTATTLEPTKGKRLDTPKPYGIRINYEPIQRSVLRQLISEESSSV